MFTQFYCMKCTNGRPVYAKWLLMKRTVQHLWRYSQGSLPARALFRGRSRLYSAQLCASVMFESISTRCAKHASISQYSHKHILKPSLSILFLLPRFPLPRFLPLQSGVAISTPAFATFAISASPTCP